MNDTIGVKLRQAREQHRLTLQQVSETTKIRTHYLQALENDDLSAIPSAAQARGFLRIYADLLGLDVADLVPVAAPQPPASSSDVPAVPVQEAVSAPQAARPSLLTSLRERFTRRTSEGTVTSKPAEESQSASEPTTEEAQSDKRAEVAEQPSNQESSAARAASKKNTASASDEQIDVKKNASA